MQNLFECQVKSIKIDEKTGKEQKVTDTYLFDAVSFTDAEKRIHEEMNRMHSGWFTIASVKKAHYSDLYIDTEGIFYKAKVSYTDVTDDGKPKSFTDQILVTAEDIKEACQNVEAGMKEMSVDFQINAIQESPIVEFFPRKTQDNG